MNTVNFKKGSCDIPTLTVVSLYQVRKPIFEKMYALFLHKKPTLENKSHLKKYKIQMVFEKHVLFNNKFLYI